MGINAFMELSWVGGNQCIDGIKMGCDNQRIGGIKRGWW